jgi:hypothetical protein
MRHDHLTYRYPRTTQELDNRYPCNAEEAKAFHGPYKGEWDPDHMVLWVCVAIFFVLFVMAVVGWL